MQAFMLESLQKALNYYLRLDPESQQRLQGLAGKVIKVELLGLQTIFYVVFTTSGIQLQSDEPAIPDAIIRGTPIRLLHTALSPTMRSQFFADDVAVQGNLEIGFEVIDLFDSLEVDWEEYLSQWVGDVPAHQFGRLTKRIKSWCQYAKKTFLQDVNEYAHEEVNLFPPKEALEDFFQAVDTLRMDVDRLEMKMDSLTKIIQAKRGVI